MSPTVPLALALSLLVLLGEARSEKLADTFTLIRESLKYWRRIYRTYHEEVVLGYCWAEYVLNLGEGIANLPMSRAINQDRLFHESTSGDVTATVKFPVRRNESRKNVEEDEDSPPGDRAKYVRRKRSHGALNLADPNLQASKTSHEQFAPDYSDKFPGGESRALRGYSGLAKKSLKSKSAKTDARYVRRSSLKPRRRRKDVFSKSTYRETSHDSSQVKNDLPGAPCPASALSSSQISREQQEARSQRFLSIRRNPRIVKTLFGPKPQRYRAENDWKVRGNSAEDLEDRAPREVFYREMSHDASSAIGDSNVDTFSSEVPRRANWNSPEPPNRFLLADTAIPSTFQIYHRSTTENPENNERDRAYNEDDTSPSTLRCQTEGCRLRALRTNPPDNTRDKRDTSAQTKRHPEELLSAPMKTGVSSPAAKVAHNSALSLVNKSSERLLRAPPGATLVENAVRGARDISSARANESHRDDVPPATKDSAQSSVWRTIENRRYAPRYDAQSAQLGMSAVKKSGERKKVPKQRPAGAPSLVRVREQRFMEDYEGSTSGTTRNSRLSRSLGSEDQGRRSSNIAAVARGLPGVLVSAFNLHPAFMAVLRTLGLFVYVGRQIIDVIESTKVLACTKDYLWIKAINWIGG